MRGQSLGEGAEKRGPFFSGVPPPLENNLPRTKTPEMEGVSLLKFPHLLCGLEPRFHKHPVAKGLSWGGAQTVERGFQLLT